MSDVSDLAPLPSTPSHHGDHLDMEMPSPGGSFTFFSFLKPNLINVFHFVAVSELDLNSPLNYGTPSSLSSLRTPRSSGRGGTPMRQRPDVRSDRKLRQVHLGANEVKKFNNKIFCSF